MHIVGVFGGGMGSLVLPGGAIDKLKGGRYSRAMRIVGVHSREYKAEERRKGEQRVA